MNDRVADLQLLLDRRQPWSRRRFGAALAALGLTTGLLTGNRPAVAKKKKKKKKPTKCTGGTTRCGKPCVQTQSDPKHCGRCGNGCGSGAICDEGICRACDVCAAGCATESVQEAIDAAGNGDTLVICPGTYAEAITIGKDLAIVGAGAGSGGTTLDAQRAACVVTIDGATSVTVRGLRITGGEAVYGGGVSNRWGATLSLRDCDISDNAAVGSGYGGGIFNDGATATLTNCTIGGNSARYGGGLCSYESGRVVLQGCAIRQNEGSEGGGAYNLGALEADTMTVFAGNEAEYAGAIENLGELTLNGTTIKENSAEGFGGGIRSGFNSDATLTGCALMANVRSGLLVNGGRLRVTNCVLTENTEYAVLISAGEVEIAGSRVHGNPGAGLYIDAAAALSLADSKVYDHDAWGIVNHGALSLDEAEIYGNAGGISNSGNGAQATLRDSIIRDNQVAENAAGGGIANGDHATMHLIDSTISGNTAGGGAGIYNWQAGELILDNTTVRGNRARSSRGGGIASLGTVTITGGEIVENTASWHGGGISNEGNLAVNSCDIRANVAGSPNPVGTGGGLWNGEAGMADLTDVTVRNNRSADGGGGITNAPGATLRLLGTSSVTNNKPANCTGSPYCP